MNKACHSATEARESWVRWLSRLLKGPAEGAATDSVFLEGVLPQDEYLKRLRSEKRRVDRSRAPLSMVLFVLGEELLRSGSTFSRGFGTERRPVENFYPKLSIDKLPLSYVY